MAERDGPAIGIDARIEEIVVQVAQGGDGLGGDGLAGKAFGQRLERQRGQIIGARTDESDPLSLPMGVRMTSQ